MWCIGSLLLIDFDCGFIFIPLLFVIYVLCYYHLKLAQYLLHDLSEIEHNIIIMQDSKLEITHNSVSLINFA